MNRKLRLLVTTKCNNKCPMCCNNSWDFSSLPVVDRWDYDEIMITGGEPLLYVPKLTKTIQSIKNISELSGNNSKIYVYTAINEWHTVFGVLHNADGIVLTPHNKKDIEPFIELNNHLIRYWDISKFDNKSLRLNLFPDMKLLLPENIDLSKWNVKDIEWLDNCPIPQGEDFRRIKTLW